MGDLGPDADVMFFDAMTTWHKTVSADELQILF